MKTTKLLVSSAVAAVLVAAFSAPASASLDFTELVQADPISSDPDARFNGFQAANFNFLNTTPFANRYAPNPTTGSVVRVTSTTAGPTEAVLDWIYPQTHPGRGTTSTISYGGGDGPGTYDLVVQMGPVTVAGGGTLELQDVSFSEFGSALFSNAYAINQTITSADDGRIFLFDIPTAAIPNALRDNVDVVRLTFLFTGSGTDFGVNAVANPEPGTLALFGLGACGLVGLVRRRRRRARAEAAADA